MSKPIQAAGVDRSTQDAARDTSTAPAGDTAQGWLESLLEMEGLGKEYWEGVDPDEYVRKLREGWD